MARSRRLLALALAAAFPAGAQVYGLAARVNGTAITNERLERYFEEWLRDHGRQVASIGSPEAYKSMKREALDELVDRELLWQEARRRKRIAGPKEVDAAMARFRQQLPDPERRRRQLEAAGFTEETYADLVRRELSVRMLVEKDLVPRVKVSDRDVREFYRANADRLAQAEGARPEVEVREAIRASLRSERLRGETEALVAELRREAKIEILIPFGEPR